MFKHVHSYFNFPIYTQHFQWYVDSWSYSGLDYAIIIHPFTIFILWLICMEKTPLVMDVVSFINIVFTSYQYGSNIKITITKIGD